MTFYRNTLFAVFTMAVPQISQAEALCDRTTWKISHSPTAEEVVPCLDTTLQSYNLEDTQRELSHAVAKENLGLVQKFLGAEVEILGLQELSTHSGEVYYRVSFNALRRATSKEMLSLLLEGQRDETKVLALGDALSWMNPRDVTIDRVRLLVDMGANVNYRNFNGNTPLHGIILHAPSRELQVNLEIIAFLIEKGANVNARTDNGTTPLTRAAAHPSTPPELIAVLLTYGADINAKDGEGLSPLLHTYRRWRLVHVDGSKSQTQSEPEKLPMPPLTKYLIENGANVNAQDANGGTILFYAAAYEDTETINYLLDNGIDPSIRDNNDTTAFDYAVKGSAKFKTSQAYWRLSDARFQ